MNIIVKYVPGFSILIASVYLVLQFHYFSKSIEIQQKNTETKVTADNFIQQLIENKEFAGLQYVVFTPSEILYKKAAGYADIKNKIPLRLDHRMNIFSVTKTVTGTAILQLHEKGLISLDEKLKTYLPEMPYDVTLRQMLSHESGIKNPVWGNFFIHWPDQNISFKRHEFLYQIVNESKKLKFKPGSSVFYSNLAYAILGELIEKITGLSYEDYIRKNILHPLDIKDHEMGFDVETVADQAKPYYKSFSKYSIIARFIKGGWIQHEGTWNSLRYPWYFDFPSHGGLVCSPSGFVHFFQDLMSDHPVLLKPETKKEFFRPQNDKFSITWQIAGEGIYKHSGGGIGYATEVRVYKDKKIATLLFANISDTKKVGKTIDTLDEIFIK